MRDKGRRGSTFATNPHLMGVGLLGERRCFSFYKQNTTQEVVMTTAYKSLQPHISEQDGVEEEWKFSFASKGKSSRGRHAEPI
jgi:hypothetical protein